MSNKIYDKKFIGSIFLLSIFFILIIMSSSQALANPVVLYTDILSGPNTGGENNNGIYLSLFGKGFGNQSDLGTSTRVYINNVEVAAYKYLGPSNGRTDIQQLSIQPGSNVTSGAIKVVVSGITSNTNHTFTVRPGAIYFVSHSGSDTTGTVNDITKPFRTVQTTWNRSDFGAGDTIVMRGDGTDWNDGTVFLDTAKGGSPGSPVTLMGYPGETVNIKQKHDSKTIRPTSGGFINFTGFKIIKWEEYNSGTNNCAFALNGSGDYRLVNLDISGSQAEMLGAINIAPRTAILGCLLHDNGRTIPADHNNSHGIYAHSQDVEIGWTEIRNQSGGRGIQLRTGGGINADIHDNIIHSCDRSAIIISDDWTTGIRIYNNIFYDNSVDGQGAVRFYSSSIAVSTEVFNNTFYEDNAYPISIEASLSSPPIFKNNIFYQTRGSYCNGSCSNAIWSNNLWYGSGSAPSWDVNSLNSNPNFENATSKDFHLKPASPAIDKGIEIFTVTTDYDGNQRPMDGDNNGSAQFDIGAYEYTGTYIPLPPPTYACSDGADNDGDGLVDYPDDPGCSSPTDTNEYNTISDKISPAPPTSLSIVTTSK
jgi:hypothetical protein